MHRLGPSRPRVVPTRTGEGPISIGWTLVASELANINRDRAGSVFMGWETRANGPTVKWASCGLLDLHQPSTRPSLARAMLLPLSVRKNDAFLLQSDARRNTQDRALYPLPLYTLYRLQSDRKSFCRILLSSGLLRFYYGTQIFLF